MPGKNLLKVLGIDVVSFRVKLKEATGLLSLMIHLRKLLTSPRNVRSHTRGK